MRFTWGSLDMWGSLPSHASFWPCNGSAQANTAGATISLQWHTFLIAHLIYDYLHIYSRLFTESRTMYGTIVHVKKYTCRSIKNSEPHKKYFLWLSGIHWNKHDSFSFVPPWNYTAFPVHSLLCSQGVGLLLCYIWRNMQGSGEIPETAWHKYTEIRDSVKAAVQTHLLKTNCI